MKKNDLGMIIFAKSLVWHHTPKIIDQTEISATLRAHKNMIVADISKKCKILISILDFCLSIEGRGGVRNFCLIDDFWGMIPRACFCKVTAYYDDTK